MLTEDGRTTGWPRYSPDGSRLAFAQSTGRDDPATRVVEADGRISTWPSGRAWVPSPGSADGGGIVTSQLESVDSYRLFNDLYAVELDGRQNRLTRGERVAEPDVLRDGRMVAVRGGGEWNALVMTDGEGRIIAPAGGQHARARTGRTRAGRRTERAWPCRAGSRAAASTWW